MSTACRSIESETEKLAAAHDRLRHDVDAAGELEDVVEGLRRFDEITKTVPAPVRAIHSSQVIAEGLVDVLRTAGVRFADDEQAPTQVAAALYAGWLSTYRRSGVDAPDAADWLFAASMLAPAIEHAIRTADGAPEIARSLINEGGSYDQ